MIIGIVIYYSIDAMLGITLAESTALGLVVEVVRAMYESILIWNFFVLVSGYIVYEQDVRIFVDKNKIFL